MKKIFVLCIFMLGLMGYAQDAEITYSPKDLDMPPECPATLNDFKMCIARNFSMPEGVEGGVFNLELSFVVEKNGTLTTPALVKDPGNGFNEAAVKAFNSSCSKNRWVAGRLNGKKVRTKMVILLTVKFRDE